MVVIDSQGETDMTEDERFLNFVMPEPNTGCWLWIGADNGHGYGGFRRSSANGGKWELAHRVSYKIYKGEIPKGLLLDHLCRNRCCVNPDHLEPVTNKENIRRGNTGENNRKKKCCPQGHPYSGENLYINTNGRRECRTCIKEKQKNARRRS